MTQAVAVVLAAGKSTRMKSDKPKVLHEIFGRPMIEYVLDAARGAGVGRIVVAVGHKAELVRDALSHHDDVVFALQAEQMGTGHAVMVCEDALRDHNGPTMILAGDTPLLESTSLQALLDSQKQHAAACVIGTADTQSNAGLGRVVRSADGEFERIVEEKDASDAERKITEINTGCYAFDNQSLLAALKQLRPENKQAEYYLTDCPRIMLDAGQPVTASCTLEIGEAMGVNTRMQLAEVIRIMQERFLNNLMIGGVTIVDPSKTFVDLRTNIGRDTVVHPFSVINGTVEIGSNCTIGPHAVINGPATLADGTTVRPFEIFGDG